ncbi:MAG: DUF934 domain-containing protein [Rubrimonas sp.]|uniref:DUF934 domain-containing protein n=1 Tax=Rubrimonas sp. TaxID=2036015 RepID=UPI002FDDFC62
MPIVDETGFAPDDAPDWREARPAEGERGVALLLDPDADAAAIAADFARIALIGVRFSAFTDGRGFSLARRLRALGYSGRLRAVGALIPDQLRHARACGFDEVQIDAARAARQPEADWRRAAAAAPPPFVQRRAQR